MKTPAYRIVLAVTVTSFSGCTTTGEDVLSPTTAEKATEVDSSTRYLTGEIPAIPGPKRVVARELWAGRVVEVEGSSVSINAGSSVGLKLGDRFRSFRIGEILTNPVTGQEISRREQDMVYLEITSVEPRLASGPFTATAPKPPARGDYVIVAASQ